MSKVAFLGFGEVNTPVDVIVRKCSAAEAALKAEGLDSNTCSIKSNRALQTSSNGSLGTLRMV